MLGTNMTQLTDLHRRLGELNRDFPRPGLPPLELSRLYDLQTDWPKAWPGCESSGVYVFIGEGDEVLYIGKTSCAATIGGRLGHYFGYNTDKTHKIYNEFYSDVRRVGTIGLPRNHEFEVPAVEEFLISRVKPRLNTQGKGWLDLAS
jgi:hypothetical protein